MKTLLTFILSLSFCLAAEENFILINGSTCAVIKEYGAHLDQRLTPCSTFKIPLCLMGYDSGVLKDRTNPPWLFQNGYDDDFETWKSTQTPESWMKCSCIWYSKLISMELGLEKLQSYVIAFEYGNQNLGEVLIPPGPIHPAWIKSTLKISPREQVFFIRKMLLGDLPVSQSAVEFTKSLLFVGDLGTEWKLFGKTGRSEPKIKEDSQDIETRWFVGWIEKDTQFFPFAYCALEKATDPDQRITRTKQFIEKLTLLEVIK